MGLVYMSAAAGVLVLVVALLRKMALNTLPKTMFLVLWGVVLLRLVLPFSLPVALPFSLYSGTGFRHWHPSEPGEATAAASAQHMDTPAQPCGETIALLPYLGAPFLPGREAVAYASAPGGVRNVWEIVWIAGVLSMGGVFIASYVKGRRKLRTALPVETPFIRHWLAAHRLLRPLRIYQSELTATPMVLGTLRPRIILPKALDRGDTALLSMVLAHEYCHIRRFDTAWKALLSLALCLHWFNPLVWLMYVLANRDLELSCDAWVLRGAARQSKKAYARALINMAERPSSLPALGFSFFGNAKIIEERIVSVMKAKKTTVGMACLAVVLVSVLTVTVFAAINNGNGEYAPAVYDLGEGAAYAADENVNSEEMSDAAEDTYPPDLADRLEEVVRNFIADNPPESAANACKCCKPVTRLVRSLIGTGADLTDAEFTVPDYLVPRLGRVPDHTDDEWLCPYNKFNRPQIWVDFIVALRDYGMERVTAGMPLEGPVNMARFEEWVEIYRLEHGINMRVDLLSHKNFRCGGWSWNEQTRGYIAPCGTAYVELARWVGYLNFERPENDALASGSSILYGLLWYELQWFPHDLLAPLSIIDRVVLVCAP